MRGIKTMNKSEFSCVHTLTELVEDYGLVGIKTSFEDEGASFEETIRLKEICNQARTKLTIKIGGPEAIRDMVDATTIGVKGMVAPMIESPFALQKFIQSAHNNINLTSLQAIQLGINIETITAVQNINTIIDISKINNLYSVTLGRVDLVSSMGRSREYVNSKNIFDMAHKCAVVSKNAGLKFYVGGAISIDSFDFLNNLYVDGLLDKFETRYAIYDGSTLKKFNEALLLGQKFEYLWLKTKAEHYYHLSNRDNARIKMIEDRINAQQ